MRAAFFHDTPLFVDEKNHYYSVVFPYKLWRDRYLKNFDEMSVSTRARNIEKADPEAIKGYSRADGEYVTMLPITAYDKVPDAFFHRKKMKAQIDEALQAADLAIIRLPSIIGLAACKRAVKLKKPWAVEVVTCAKDAYRGQGLKGKLIAGHLYRKNKKYIAKADRALYVTRDFLQKRYPTKAPKTAVSNAMIEEPELEVLRSRLKKIDKGSKPIKFGLVGSLNVNFKGHDTAIRALAEVKHRIPPFELHFLGYGDQERWRKFGAKVGIGDRIKFCGTLPMGEPVLKWMDELDILLVPSLQEGLPRALIEGMSRGCPALGARTGGIPELIDEEFLHKKKDYIKLSEDICRLLNDKKLMQSAAVSNFATSREYYTKVLDQKRFAFWKEFADDVAARAPLDVIEESDNFVEGEPFEEKKKDETKQ